jgi:hypothetical protein
MVYCYPQGLGAGEGVVQGVGWGEGGGCGTTRPRPLVGMPRHTYTCYCLQVEYNILITKF